MVRLVLKKTIWIGIALLINLAGVSSQVFGAEYPCRAVDTLATVYTIRTVTTSSNETAKTCKFSIDGVTQHSPSAGISAELARGFANLNAWKQGQTSQDVKDFVAILPALLSSAGPFPDGRVPEDVAKQVASHRETLEVCVERFFIKKARLEPARVNLPVACGSGAGNPDSLEVSVRFQQFRNSLFVVRPGG